MRPGGPRDPVAGPDAGPEPPFPIKLFGPVIRGFGRGSKELGIPTANIPPSGLSAYPDLSTGVYYGFVGLLVPSSFLYTTSARSTTTSTDTPEPHVLPAVLSIGYNPFYSNKTRSIEIHILPPLSPSSSNSTTSASPPPSKAAPVSIFAHDFYGSPLNLLILGHIRPEYDYVSLDALVEDIRVDCEVAAKSLEREGYRKYANEGEGRRWLEDFGWVKRDEKTGQVLYVDDEGKETGAPFTIEERS